MGHFNGFLKWSFNWNAGYIRVLMNIVAFALCFSNKIIFSVLYFVRWVLNFLDSLFFSNNILIQRGGIGNVFWLNSCFQLCMRWCRWVVCSQIQSRYLLTLFVLLPAICIRSNPCENVHILDAIIWCISWFLSLFSFIIFSFCYSVIWKFLSLNRNKCL